MCKLFAILQKYDFSSKSQLKWTNLQILGVVCDTAKVRFFKQITTVYEFRTLRAELFAILQKYDFSSKSQLNEEDYNDDWLFAILQKYDFSSKSQRP